MFEAGLARFVDSRSLERAIDSSQGLLTTK